ncbi:MAG: WecB/TagA/CpsF family glycosyltransferase, partial [Chloroflexota bacterium]|nr:WecB/TagA/CpsF family glycosyltransferase [Chloroflexota bacterium]
MSPTYNVLGVGISAINMSQALEQLGAWIAGGDRQYVCVCNVHSVMECRRSREVRRVFNRAGMVTPDGMPLVWLSRMAGYTHVSRVYGPDLMLAAMERSLTTGHRHYLHGGLPGVAQELAGVMRRRFPGVAIVGAETPAFGTADELCNDAVAANINQAQPDIVWVGMSSPKQDLWMSCMRPRLHASVLIAVGAAFDFHTGRVPQA